MPNNNRKPEMRLQMERTFDLAPERIWELLSNNNRLNRAIGLDPVYKGVAAAGSISRSMTSTAAKVWPMQWEEYPFEWEQGRWYEVFRDYSRGPMRMFRSGIELTEEDGRTKLRLYSNVRAASRALLPLIRRIAVSSMKKTFAYVDQAIDAASSELALAIRHLPVMAKNSAADKAKLSILANRLVEQGCDIELVRLLQATLEEGGDEEIAEMQPFRLADSWGMERGEVLKLLLRATQIGMLNLEWRLICPNCRVADTGASVLAELPGSYHCDWCGVDYDAVFDRYVELCFSAHREIRDVKRSIYCVGSPAFSPHIRTQRLLRAGESVTLDVPHDEGWRLRVLRGNEKLRLLRNRAAFDSTYNGRAETISPESSILCGDASLLSSVHPGSSMLTIELDAQGWKSEAVVVLPGQELHIHSRRDKDVMIVLEREAWGDSVATAAHVTLFPEFRTLFASDVLAPGQQVGIQSLTVLFTDLCGSTAYYEQVGDAEAYGYVREMFDFLDRTVQAHRGAVVKTIGDAVMAVFDRPEEGVLAALHIQEHWPAANGLRLRVGLHHGPAVTVGMNGRNDYFGRTVNLASRIQASGNPGEIVLASDMANLVGDQIAHKRQTPFTTALKGVEELAHLVRIGG
ncbi:adenylate/guanylate cyclase domain-containing protein [Paenibacillus aurantiacus]|uniref:Adenylate/guanylate cyclase domain-containing protein n=1 Tax=Paenibacillus aurantiacus TaxID=1936118 RepID=A0ABV5KYB1_9BACL